MQNKIEALRAASCAAIWITSYICLGMNAKFLPAQKAPGPSLLKKS
jgi:hypothetical protein